MKNNNSNYYKEQRKDVVSRRIIDDFIENEFTSYMNGCNVIKKQNYSLLRKIFEDGLKCGCSYYAEEKCCNVIVRDVYISISNKINDIRKNYIKNPSTIEHTLN